MSSTRSHQAQGISVTTTTNKLRSGRPKAAENRLNRELIVATALALIDRDGLESFSVRNVAKALDVFPTAVYWHIGDRNTLLSDVVTLVLADLTPKRAPPRWQDWIRQLLVRYRDIIRQHPNVAPLIGVQLVSNGSLDFRLVEGILDCLSQAGFKNQRLIEAYNVVMAGMVGFTTQEFASVPAEGTEGWKKTMRRSIAAVDKQAYPRVAAHLSAMTNKAFLLRWENGVSAPLDAGFNMFADALVAGIEALTKEKHPSARRPARGK
jgi:AcrR family transcriptional regulator